MSTLDVRLTSAVAAGKLARLASRRLGLGGGTALPGVIAARLDRAALAKLTRGLPRGAILVTGTNGKTTTSRLLVAILEEAGWHPIHNRSGANLASGLTTALIEQSTILGQSLADSALFEVDEAVLPTIQGLARPRVILFTNLFRDQLDRYGEVDHVASVWRAGLRQVDPSSTIVLNADDPALAALGQNVSGRALYYGIDTPGEQTSLDQFADSRQCPVCGAAFSYETVRYGHLGIYRCPRGDFERPRPQIRVTDLVLRGVESSEVEITGPFGARRWSFRLPGLYNVYNLLAAVAAATAVGVDVKNIAPALARTSAAFGRLERMSVNGRTLFFVLVKNPVGFSEALRTILAEPGEKNLAIFINDNLADGTDVSWLWDAEIEQLAGRCRQVVASGTRGADMAVRLKYAGVPAERVRFVESSANALDQALAVTEPGDTLYVVPTYTAMLELRTLAGRRGYAGHFWEN